VGKARHHLLRGIGDGPQIGITFQPFFDKSGEFLSGECLTDAQTLRRPEIEMTDGSAGLPSGVLVPGET
jgi:hypothetical protein